MGLGLVLTPQPFLRLLRTLGKWLLFLCGWPPKPAGLHTARFATKHELAAFQTSTLPTTGLLLGTTQQHRIIAVQPTPTHKELGNLLVVGRTRSGKGLFAKSVLLSWPHSVIVNDIKGELYAATARFRSRLGPVFAPGFTGVGNHYDPLSTRHTEDELFSAATSLLMTADEGDGFVFTQRAVVMLTQLLLAARKEQTPPFPYVRQLIRLGLVDAARWVHAVDPALATQLLDGRFEEMEKTDRFLLSAWSTLSARLRPLLTETLVRCFTKSDFSAADLLLAKQPITVYLRWPERDLLALSPVVRLMWESLIGELITTYDRVQGEGCQPVLLLLDEAGRTAIPALAEHATTVVGRGISLWVAIQSLSQLETVYGKARAQTLRDNMDSQIYYRPTDLQTAAYLEERLGSVSAYAKSISYRDGEETGESRAERPIPLLSAQQILQLPDEEIIGFHRRLPPLRLTRMDWRQHPELVQRHELTPPDLQVLAPVPEASFTRLERYTTSGYLDIDTKNYWREVQPVCLSGKTLADPQIWSPDAFCGHFPVAATQFLLLAFLSDCYIMLFIL